MTAIIGFDAREGLNLALLYRYIISYEPYQFKGRLTDFPLTLAYGKKIDALRRKYREFFGMQSSGTRWARKWLRMDHIGTRSTVRLREREPL